MNATDLTLRLLQRLRDRGQPAAALGIDLGTTRIRVAYAQFDPVTGQLDCDCVRFPQDDGTTRIGIPSAVAVGPAGPEFGAAALARRGQKGYLPEHRLFYETKNEIGLRYSYVRAPEGFKNASEVATRMLAHARASIPDPALAAAAAPIVVTVPASFHGAQRLATVAAAERAFEPGAIRLLDEPYAAFLDLKWRLPEVATGMLQEDANLMVFDFGGGTCDVAIFRIDTVRGGTLGARLLGSSRYHRLGGGDIDRAIVHDVLIPAVLQENALARWDLSWYEKRRLLEPALLATAEQLKLALSRRLAELHASGKHPQDTLDVTTTAQSFDIVREGTTQTLTLARPRLTLGELKTSLTAFLDPDPPPEAGDEFVQRSSIFSPIVQALFRAGLDPQDVQGILLCGSSAQLPLVREALRAKFPQAAHVLVGDADDLEGAVARGAALQALSLQVLGQPLIAPVSSSEVSLRVVSGAVPLVRTGEPVPSASQAPSLLRPPRDSAHAPIDIAVEVIGDGERLVGRSLWTLPPPVSTTDRLALDWRIDENQCIELQLTRMDATSAEPFRKRFDAPITHRDPGQLVRCRKLEREEAIRNDQVPRADLGRAFEELARDCGVLGEYEKGLHFLSLSMQEVGAASPYLLNLRGIYRERVGNNQGALDSYTEAAQSWTTARFNLALLRSRQGQQAAALVDVDAAIADDPKRAYRVLRGDILAKLGRRDESRAEWQDAIAGQPDWTGLDDFELAWLQRAAVALDQSAVRDRIAAERQRFATPLSQVARQGELPEYVGADRAMEI